jgi:hypothetical protein
MSAYVCKCIDEKDCAIECVKAKEGPNAVYVQPENTIYFNPKRPNSMINRGLQMNENKGSMMEIHRAIQAAKKINPDAPLPNIIRV